MICFLVVDGALSYHLSKFLTKVNATYKHIRKVKSYNLGMQIPCCVYPQIPLESVVRGVVKAMELQILQTSKKVFQKI